MHSQVLIDSPALADAPPRPDRRDGCPVHALFGPRVPEAAASSLAGRVGVFAFGLIAYLMFFGTICYAIGFVTGLVVPKHINSGVVAGDSIVSTILVNAGLLSLFVVQHTVMARPAFKRWFTRFVPAAMERSIFVAAASLCLMLTFWQWRPMPGVIWDVSTRPILYWTLIGIALGGWAVVFLSSFMVSHFDLFGLRQAWLRLIGRPYEHVAFRLVGFYKIVRHPLMVGFLIAFWVTPTMTTGHMFFASLTTLYILFGTWIEERDLVAHFGDTYLEYQRRVRAFVPLPRRNG